MVEVAEEEKEELDLGEMIGMMLPIVILVGVMPLFMPSPGEAEEVPIPPDETTPPGSGISTSEFNALMQAINGANTFDELSAVLTNQVNPKKSLMTGAQYDQLYQAYRARFDLIKSTYLSIRCEPAGYGFPIYIDGSYQGTSPLLRWVSPGQHTVSFGVWTGSSYKTPAPITVTVAAGETKEVVGIYVRETAAIEILDVYWYVPMTYGISYILAAGRNPGMPIDTSTLLPYPVTLLVKYKNPTVASFGYRLEVYLGATLITSNWVITMTYPGAEGQNNIFLVIPATVPDGQHVVKVKAFDYETNTLLKEFTSQAKALISTATIPPPPPPPTGETVAIQLASCIDKIDGAGGVWQGYYIAVLRAGETAYRFYDQTNPNVWARVDQVGYFITGDQVWLYAKSPCTLTYLGRSWNLVTGWNQIYW